MTDFSKVLGVIAKALKLDATELSAALKDGDDNFLTDDEITPKLSEIIVREVKAARAEARDRAIAETHGAVDKLVKSKGFTPEAGLKGTALLESFIEHIESKTTKIDPAEVKTLTVEELAKLPEVKKLMADAVDKFGVEAKAQVEAIRKEYDEYKGSAESKRTDQIAKAYLAKALEKGNVLLKPAGSEMVSAEDRIDNLYLDIKNRMKIRLNDKDEPIFVREDGSQLTDEDLGKPISFDEFAIKRGLSLYGLRGPDPNKGGGDPKPGTGNGEYKAMYKFQNEKEYNDLMATLPPGPERAQAAKDYQHQQQQKAAG